MNQENTAGLIELLPFTISIATNIAELRAAVEIRQSAYARHLPDVAKAMGEPEDADFREGTVIFVARSKVDGSPVGTMRTHTNEFAPLPLEQSVKLPEEYIGLRLMEATRFAVSADRVGMQVKNALLKTLYIYSLAEKVDRLVITARAPLDRMYERLMFTDVDESAGFIPMAHVGGIPHRVLQVRVADGKPMWQAAKHPLYRYMAETEHPDIVISGAPAVREKSSTEALSSETA